MSILESIRANGFDVRLLAGMRIGVTPVEQLKDQQRRWIREHRDELVMALADEAEAKSRRVADRWKRFLKHAERHGLHPRVVASEFTEGDIEDLVAPEHDDLMVRRCARTLSCDQRLRIASEVEYARDHLEPRTADLRREPLPDVTSPDCLPNTRTEHDDPN